MSAEAQQDRAEAALAPVARPAGWLIALRAIVQREFLRFLGQKGRFVSALVRPLVWLVVFAAGFRATLGLSIIPPYQTYITYEFISFPASAA